MQSLMAIGSALAVVVRWVVLLASTVLVVFVAALVLQLLWSRSDADSILIRPFVVVDLSGKIKSAENGFAQLLAVRMSDLNLRIRAAREILSRAASAQSLTIPESATDKTFEDTKSRPSVREPFMPELQAADTEKLDLKVEGVDVTGLLAWIKAQVVPKPKSVTFTMHFDGDGAVAIAGDVRDLGITDGGAVWIPPAKQSPVQAIDDLALQIFRLKMADDDSHLRDLALPELRELIEHLAALADRRMASMPSAEQRARFHDLQDYFAKVVASHGDWLAPRIIAAQTASRAGDTAAARSYFQNALDHERGVTSSARSAERLTLIQASLDAVGAGLDAEARASRSEQAVSTTGAAVRRTIDDADAAAVAVLRSGFQALYDAKGVSGFDAIAGLPGAPGFYAWNHQMNSRTSARHNLFLPWNRAFLANFERAARERIPDFALRCWDWSRQGIPKSFTTPNTPDGKPNPLLSGFINLPQNKPPISRPTRRAPGKDSDRPQRADVDAVLSRDDWADFSSALEDLSDQMHGWTGGDMGVIGTSAYDPLYYAQRCMVDRLWATWQAKHPPLDGPAAMETGLLDVVLEPFALRVRDVLDIGRLGYRYE